MNSTLSQSRPDLRQRSLSQAIAVSISGALMLGLQVALSDQAHAQVFPASIQPSSLDGSNGFVLNGEAEGDASGFSVSAAGDINGDGVDDLLIGAIAADPNGSSSGRSYVLFGTDHGLPNPFQLSSLDGSNGFVLNGESQDDYSGISVSGAGDVNGDGIDDLIIGATRASPNGIFSGRSYVVFGSAADLPNPFELSSLDGSNGFVLNGEAQYDNAGRAVSGAGDINGDGINDLLVGAMGANANGQSSGRTYVVFGDGTGMPAVLELSSLNGTSGFVLNGEAEGDFSGRSLSAAGDINGDGMDDLIIGADGAAPNGGFSGRSYVVFGASAGLPNPFELSNLDGSNGFVLNGEAQGDDSGISVSGVGDINGDDVDDLIIGAPGANASGRSYLVFGNSAGFNAELELSSLNGSNGIVINGAAAGDFAGFSVSAAGDINGDGIDDLIVGAYRADTIGNNSNAGRSYVVFGAPRLPNPFELSSLNGNNGFVVDGEVFGEVSGRSVSAGGDINGDGIGDIVIGADGANANGIGDVGRSYVVFGRSNTLFVDGFEADQPTRSCLVCKDASTIRMSP